MGRKTHKPAVKIAYSPRCLKYESPGHPESPLRVKLASDFLKAKGFEFIEPPICREDDIHRVHSVALVDKVRSGSFFDPNTPVIPGIFDYAALSAGGAIAAAERCLENNENSFSLMRPPGHHASRQRLGGFCYFNNLAIAVCRVMEKVSRVAILDLDAHHGNGTQSIFQGKEGVLYVSLHQGNIFPGTGLQNRENALNYPLPAGTEEPSYLSVLEQALFRIAEFKPGLLAISLGIDTYKDDPLTDLRLEISSYAKIGRMINALSLPAFAILEGGYSAKLGECIYEFLCGWDKSCSKPALE